jgi:hypothetical protein
MSIIRAIIALMMAAARTSETSVDIQLRIRQYIPEDSKLHALSLFFGLYLPKNSNRRTMVC